ncbi:MAG TPA: 3-hydroxyacyl-CoA dehydrogenase/enoyl-CoA hydratase family protein, partial [Candidatus Limnocylindria bacterium]|nr:3-hydroxyacyl-CoA dehydrogenase/enoyl-CoA hydratase family protein [Candidatus Limnocylindria bacterium]
MTPRIGSAVVVGAGTMGAQIAALLAGAGVRVRLFDMTADVAQSGLDRVAKLKPAPLYTPAHLSRIRVGGLDQEGGLESAMADADWILEAIVEQLEPKRALLERIDAALGDWTRYVTTNTSGLSIGALADGRSEAFRRRFFGTHFFNPPRYTRLLELIPLDDTDPSAVQALAGFASVLLGKGTVVARDTPAFIANRLGVHGLMVALRLAQELGLGPDEVDELTGPLIGRPKSATFRTLDLVGIDVAAAVADHCHADLVDDPERDTFLVPPVMRGLLEKGALGEKTGAGFYRKEGGEILALDLERGDYRPRRTVASAAVSMARNETDLAKRLRMLIGADDTAGEFLRRALASNLGYAARIGPDIADGVADIDAAMRLGFGWELGPFQVIAALGDAAAQLLPETELPPQLYDNGSAWRFDAGALAPIAHAPGSTDLARLRTPELPSNSAASVVELQDNILGLELHGKLNVIGLDTISMIERAVALAGERHDGLVIGTAAPDFSAGANLALMLIEAEEGEWDELDRVVRRFQGATQAIRHSPVPVVVAPRGRTLGGGAELVLAAARAQPLAETYIGLVELGVGLVPAGGGSTAMARRIAERLPVGARDDLFPLYSHVFMAIATATVATSAWEAREYLFVSEADPITANPDRQWADAARTARTLTHAGYRPPGDVRFPVLGRRGIAAAESLSYNQLVGRHISEYDRRLVLELASVMSGGDVAEGTLVS